jgi:hypothetical protein
MFENPQPDDRISFVSNSFEPLPWDVALADEPSAIQQRLSRRFSGEPNPLMLHGVWLAGVASRHLQGNFAVTPPYLETVGMRADVLSLRLLRHMQRASTVAQSDHDAEGWRGAAHYLYHGTDTQSALEHLDEHLGLQTDHSVGLPLTATQQARLQYLHTSVAIVAENSFLRSSQHFRAVSLLLPPRTHDMQVVQAICSPPEYWQNQWMEDQRKGASSYLAAQALAAGS